MQFQRARISGKGGMFKSKEAISYERQITLMIREKWKDQKPLKGLLVLVVIFHFPLRAKDELQFIPKDSSPDLDNLKKVPLDCLHGAGSEPSSSLFKEIKEYKKALRKYQDKILTRSGVIENDANIFISHSEKFFSPKGSMIELHLFEVQSTDWVPVKSFLSLFK